MATFDITVDTSPMANSLNYVNSNVRDVTSSVIAMESAVVIAQQEASAHICKNVDTGFYILMKSQFDQKIAAVSSEMLSKMQLMETFKNEIDKIMLIMQDDYERIKVRYLKHFSSLDSALETRIHELDKKAYDIAKDYKLSQFKTGGEIIKAICYSDDTQLINVKQTNAVVKTKSAKSIDIMTNDVLEQLHYSDSVKNILKKTDFEERQPQYIPIIFSENDSMISQESIVKNIYSSSETKYSTDSKFLNILKEKSKDFTWNEVGDETFEAVKNYFQAKIGSEITDDRVAKEMIRLFDESKWSETGGNVNEL